MSRTTEGLLSPNEVKCSPLARITSKILISQWSIALSIIHVRSVPSSSLALLSDDPSRESFVGREVSGVASMEQMEQLLPPGRPGPLT